MKYFLTKVQMAVPSLCVISNYWYISFHCILQISHLFFFLNKLKVCGNRVLSKSTVTISCIF